MVRKIQKKSIIIQYMFSWLKYVDLSPYVEIIDDVAFNRSSDKFTTFQKDAQTSIQNRRASQFM